MAPETTRLIEAAIKGVLGAYLFINMAHSIVAWKNRTVSRWVAFGTGLFELLLIAAVVWTL